ncbi:helix-turn-helix transcriptional regulator [Actinomadura rudentiformis]|uniref:Helix-turn-helix transcriptional regulator n=2 Tax=Actinomadura rudentiformis TaxID=359158 RepID=A0A6H9YW34_9ACTN|nr:helix-turn-helix transcriptional regulator [Actinomadura rudentiformis]
MVEVAAEKGYVATSVADVLKRSRVSRLTFYENFANKEACFIAAYELVTDILAERMEAALRLGGTPLERFDRVIGAYLAGLAAEPEAARVFLVEVYAAGVEVLGRRLTVQATLTEWVAELFGAVTAEQRLACESAVGALISLVTTRVLTGDHAGLAALREPFVAMVARLMNA